MMKPKKCLNSGLFEEPNRNSNKIRAVVFSLHWFSWLPREVEEKIQKIDTVKSCEVEITFDPPWSKDLMSEEAKLELGML